MSSTASPTDSSHETGQQQAVTTDTLVEHHLGLVMHLAKRYARSYQGHHILDLEDLYQEGVLGLMHAAEKFDARKGFRFQHVCHLLDTLGHRAGDHERIPHDSPANRHLACSRAPGSCTNRPLAAKAARTLLGRTARGHPASPTPRTPPPPPPTSPHPPPPPRIP